MSVINTNSKSIIAQNALTVNNRSMTKTMEQLSTGKRINSAADDAAGLAISSKMTSQIKGLNQAVRNANDGISLLQTAEGAMIEVTNMMQRMRELAIQSANDTNTQDERDYMDLEFQQLKEEANRITLNTQWNGMNILDASNNGGEFKFQVGANANQTIDHTIDQLSFTEVTTGASVEIATTHDGDDQTSVFTFETTADYDTDPADPTEDWKVGDVVTLKLGNEQLQYTITEDVLAGDNDAVLANLSEALTDAFDAAQEAGRFVGIEATDNTDGTIDFVGAGISFAATTSASSGSLASLDGLDVLERGTSNEAVTGLDAALKNINEARAEIGSKINRLTYAADNLANVSQNTSASRSQVLDTDYAQATTELARTQIISQAATAMLAQANQAPQSVLSLLR
jgi:flagellin